MQDPLFPEDPAEKPAARPARGSAVGAAPADPADEALAAALPASLRLGTSSWTYPGWTGLVWDRDHAETRLSREGLAAYARHPLFGAVSLDRSFYRPLTAAQYAHYASQVTPHFRFVVKAPSLVTDAVVRDESGRGRQPNPLFLDPAVAMEAFVEPVLDGLGTRLGALVFQVSPLPVRLKAAPAEVLERLDRLLAALPRCDPRAPEAVVAVEVRDAELICNELSDVLARHGATYCLGVHARLPPIEAQLPLLRRLWPGPLVCRWNLHARHGAQGYEQARDLYAPFNRLVDPDPDTRATLTRVAVATARAQLPVYVTVNNKAEGCAPLSVRELARAIVESSA